jgi:hypothetical protein
MGERGRTIFAALAMWALVSGCGAAWAHGGGARAGTPEEQAYVEARRVHVRAVEPNAFSLDRARAEREETGAASDAGASALTRPLAVDNSTLSWFPPIGSQGYQNSCVAWTVGYYYDTYTQAMDEGINVRDGDPQHVCSPAFLYPLLNDGVDEGAYLDYAMARLSVIGCSSLSLAPYDVADYTSWPSEAAWVDALSRRTQGLYCIPTNTAAGLEAVRQLLANGRLTVILMSVYDNLYYDYPASVPGIDGDVLYSASGHYVFGHTVTLVGYDDTKAYRDDRDGLVHHGAFLVANSWGTSWGVENTVGTSRGFFWIAYDAFLEGSRTVYDALYTDDRPHYRPIVYALAGISHPQRGYLELLGGAGRPTAPDAVTEAVLHSSGGTEIGVDASHRIAIDMTDLLPFIPADAVADLFISLGVAPGASSAGTIASVEILADRDGDGTYESDTVPGLPVTVGAGSVGYAFLSLFDDLGWDYWAYQYIDDCFKSGIVGGYSDDTYRPASPVDRAAMAVYISRAVADGDDNVPAGPSTPSFSDVPVDYWAYKYVEYAVANNIVTGYPEGDYRPTNVVDRGQMAVFIARSIVTPLGDEGLASYTPPATPTFPDVGTSFWAYEYIEYIAGQAIAAGYDDGTYRPTTTCTRDQMAVYVARAFNLLRSVGH